MAAKVAHRQLAASKGGIAIARLPQGARWNSATARKAARKRWDKVNPISPRSGQRLGITQLRRSPVDHATVRRLHTQPNDLAWYDVSDARWLRPSVDGPLPISERRAFVLLGYYASDRKIPVPYGTPIAVKRATRHGTPRANTTPEET